VRILVRVCTKRGRAPAARIQDPDGGSNYRVVFIPTTVPSDSTIAEGHTPPSMTAVGQGTVRRMTQFPVPLLRTNVKPARSKRVRVPL